MGLLQVRTTTSDHSVFLLSFLVEQEQGPKNNYCRSLWLLCRQVKAPRRILGLRGNIVDAAESLRMGGRIVVAVEKYRWIRVVTSGYISDKSG